MKLFTRNGLTILLVSLLPFMGKSQDAPDALLQQVCAGSCAGAIASVTPWRNSAGKIGYYEFSGDFRNCSHPPLILYDSKGQETLTIPNQPLDPNNKEMIEQFKKLYQKREELLKNHTPSKAIFCSDLHRG